MSPSNFHNWVGEIFQENPFTISLLIVGVIIGEFIIPSPLQDFLQIAFPLLLKDPTQMVMGLTIAVFFDMICKALGAVIGGLLGLVGGMLADSYNSTR